MDCSTSAVKMKNFEDQEAACLPCRFFNIVKIHYEITECWNRKLKMENSQLSNDLIWVNKERFFSTLCELKKIPSFHLFSP